MLGMIIAYLSRTAAKATAGFFLPAITLYLTQAYQIWEKSGALYIPTPQDLVIYLLVSVSTAYGVWQVPNRAIGK